MTVLVPIDVRSPSPEADCLDCLVGLPVAIEQMRLAADETDIPRKMIDRTCESFNKLMGHDRQAVLLALGGCQDLLYRYISQMPVMDRCTRTYFKSAVAHFFAQLSHHDFRTFYILDNGIAAERLDAIQTLFRLAGIWTTTPTRDGKEWAKLSARIRDGFENIGHVAYIEPDNEVNYLTEAKALAQELDCICFFRYLAPSDGRIEIIKLPES